MANLMYTQELKSSFRFFLNRTYFAFFCDYLQSDQSNFFIKPKVKIFDLHKKGRQKSHLWTIISNFILPKSSFDIAKIYISYLARKMKKKMRSVSSKYSIPLRDVIKDYLFLCNEKMQILQRNELIEKYTSFHSCNSLKTLLLSSLLPTISKNNLRLASVCNSNGGNCKGHFNGGSGEDEHKSYFQTSLFFYDANKEEKKKQTLRTPLIRIMEIDNKMQKIMKNLLLERNSRAVKNTNANTNGIQFKNFRRKRKSEVTMPSKIKDRNCISSRNKIEPKIVRVASYVAPRKEAMNIKLIKNGSKTLRKQNTPSSSKMKNKSVEMVINPKLLIHHNDLYYLR